MFNPFFSVATFADESCAAAAVFPRALSCWALKLAALVLSISFSVSALDLAAGKQALQDGDYATALKEFLPLAKGGNASAQIFLGGMYDAGRGVPRDFKEAVRWYRLAADQGDAGGQFLLGGMYGDGRGVPQDLKEAVRWYRLAADQGYAFAQYSLGMVYSDGRGVPQDFKEAVRWYRLAADQGDVGAQYILGEMYDPFFSAVSSGVQRDAKEAARWYRLAADQGDATAQFMLGMKYSNGLGVPQDYILAHMWFNLAGASGQKPAAITNRDNIALKMTPEQIAEAHRLAREWKPKASR